MTRSQDLRSLLRFPQAGPVDAGRLGRRMAALYRRWHGGGVDMGGLVHCLAAPMDVAGQPIGRACLAAAAAVEAWGGHPYHSALHHAEVATNASVLAELAGFAGAPLPASQRMLLLAAALAHDYGYEPGGARFAAETASADAMDAMASECGVSPPERGDLRCLILATEPGFRRLLAGAPPQRPVPRPLEDLLGRPDLVTLAALLSDADLLSSVGLTEQWRKVQRHRLEREAGRRIAPSEDVAFFDHVVGPGFLSAGGRYFDEHLARMRQACGNAMSVQNPEARP